MGKPSRDKGHNFERKLVRWFKEMLYPAERNLTETRTGNTGDVFVPLRWARQSQDWGPYRLVIQAKHKKSPSVWKAMEEAITAARSPSDVPVAIVRRTHDQTLVVMEPRTFAALLAGSEASWADRVEIPEVNIGLNKFTP